MNTSRFMRRRLPAVYKSVAPLALSLGLAAAALAQALQTGVISGRVYNPATGEYVRSAEVRIQGTDQIAVTDGSGYYSLRNAPAGAATVVVSYTGYEPTTNSVTVAPGGTVTQDFELKSLRGEQGQPIQLQTFTVSTEREGNAKAIMEQKVSMNAKTVMTSDSFGEIAEGNVGEFLKFMPGIQIDYVETDTRAARMGGLEARYGAVTLDGNSISNAGGASRQFEFEAASITNIEAIEINKTLSADMPANSPAGSINLRTKSALDRKGMKFNFTAAFIGNQYEHGIGQSARPDDGKHSKLRPTYVVDYSNAFFNQKVGVQLSGSWSSVFKPQHRFSPSIDYTSATAVARQTPLVTTLNFKDGTKMSDKYSLGAKIDYQPWSPALRFTFRSDYTELHDRIANRNLAFTTNAAQLDSTSSLTRMVAAQNAATRINHTGGHGDKNPKTTNIGAGFVYKSGSILADGYASYSRTVLQNGTDHLRQVDRADTNLQNIGFIATRPSVDATDWHIVQTAGRDWNDLNNYLLSGTVNAARTITKTQEFNEQINLRYNLPTDTPSFVKTGLNHNVLTRTNQRMSQRTFSWIGPSGAAATSPAPISTADFRIAQAFGGNIASLPVPDKTRLYEYFTTHPEYYTQTEAQRATDLNAILGDSTNIKEEVQSAYLMGNTRIAKLQLQGGVRYEGTETTAITMRRLPDSRNPFPVNTVNGILARWGQGRDTRVGDYDHFLPSASALYRVTQNFQMKFGYHQAIKRAPLDRLSGLIEIDEANQRISLPNPNLEPETSDKYSAMFEYYFEPAGNFSVHLFETNLKNNSERTDWGPASEFGYENDPVYGLFEFRGWDIIPGTRKVRGMEFDYRQTLSFFENKFLRSISVFATYSRYTSSPRTSSFGAPENAAAGINASYRGFYGKIKGTWSPDYFTYANTISTATFYFPGDREMRKERYIFDVDFGYNFSRSGVSYLKNLSVFVSGRNAFNAPIVWYYPKSDGRIRQKERFGGQWTVGVTGRY